MGRIIEALGLQLQEQKPITEFFGVVFPGDSLELRGGRGLIRFVDCTFAGGSGISLGQLHADVEFVGTAFLGVTALGPCSYRSWTCHGATFQGPVALNLSKDAPYRIDFSGCTFRGLFEFDAQGGLALNCRRARFEAPIRIRASGKVELSQSVSFEGAKFSAGVCGVDTEPGYRTLRQAFEKNGNRDDEATFYALEKRSQRLTLQLGPTRMISALYDWFSSYGRSYIKPLAWLLGAQLVAALGYVVASPNYKIAWGFSPDIMAFTLAQVARPFELLSAKAASPIALDVIGHEVTAGWAVVTAFHGILSLTFLALFLLAIRWRFKRS